MTEIQARGIDSFEALIELSRAHHGTGGAEIAKRVMCCAADRDNFIRLWELRRFDKWNLCHALNIMQLVGTDPGFFVKWIETNYREEMKTFLAEQIQVMAVEARVIQRYADSALRYA